MKEESEIARISSFPTRVANKVVKVKNITYPPTDEFNCNMTLGQRLLMGRECKPLPGVLEDVWTCDQPLGFMSLATCIRNASHLHAMDYLVTGITYNYTGNICILEFNATREHVVTAKEFSYCLLESVPKKNASSYYKEINLEFQGYGWLKELTDDVIYKYRESFESCMEYCHVVHKRMGKEWNGVVYQWGDKLCRCTHNDRYQGNEPIADDQKNYLHYHFLG